MYVSFWIREFLGMGFVGFVGKVVIMIYFDFCIWGNYVIDLDNNCLIIFYGLLLKFNSKILKFIVKYSLFGWVLL